MEKWEEAKMQDDRISGIFTEIHNRLIDIEEALSEMKGKLRLEREIWDNADIIQNWNVSARTLADWRAKGLIGFVQVGNKIWYPRESRELFLSNHFNNAEKGGV